MIKFNEQTGEIKVTNSTSSQTTSEKWKEYQDWLNEVPEISDEEIVKAFTIGTNQKTEYTHKIEGAKWYREKLKTKQ